MERSSNASFFYFYVMIRDWLRNIRMNYASEQMYIAQRMINEKGGWQSHLNNSQRFITDHLKTNASKSINILGSGWLFDVPIHDIIRQFDKVVLTDIYHPKQIVNKYSANKNIEFNTVDLTYGAVDLAYATNKRNFDFDKFIDTIKNIRPTSYNEDLVVSINLLSQLSIFIVDYLSKKITLNNTQIVELTSTIQLNHLKSLPQNKSIVITDYEEEFVDEEDKFIGLKPTVFIDIPRNHFTKEWTWKFDSQMTYREDCKTNLKVVAVKI